MMFLLLLNKRKENKMAANQPLVSIIIPIFNRVLYLPQAIESISKQGYEDIEIIIVDDGSTEDIFSIIKKCQAKYTFKIFYIKQKNKGPGGARNTGIKQAQGEYIAFLDSDDEWEEEFLKYTLEKLISGEYQWASTAAYRDVINKDEKVTKRSIAQSNSFKETDDIYYLLLKENIIVGPSGVIIKRKCFNEVGYFREDLYIAEDWEMWLRLAKSNFQLCRIIKPLYQYKIRQNSLTKTEPLKGLRCTYRVLCDYAYDAFKSDPGNRILYAEKMWDISRKVLHFKEKDYLLFLKSLCKSQLYDPSLTRILKSLHSFKKSYI